MKRILCLLCSLLLTATCLCSVPISAFAEEDKTPLPLHVEGRWLKNSAGETVRLVGAGLPDMTWATGGDELNERIDMLLDNWNGNMVRLGVHSKFWFGEEWYQNKDYSGYRERVDSLINRITSKGKYVILNLHEFYCITEKQKMFWQEAAKVYANHPGILFGILNEPHDISWEVWRNGGYINTKDSYGAPIKQRTYGHQEILEMIRDLGAKNICVMGGLDWAYYFDGITDGYDGLEHGYRPMEPEGDKAGNGIMYDSHCYPMKPEYNPVEKAVDIIADTAPIVIGEIGHWGERLFDWYDNYLLEYPYIWMNEMIDWMDRLQLNIAFWSFHDGASPVMVTDLNTYEATKQSGWAIKHYMLHGLPDTRPPVEERRFQDPSPLSDWEYEITFDEEGDENRVKVYGDQVQTAIVDEGFEDSGLFVNFDFNEENAGKSAAVYDIPEEQDLSGAEWVGVRIKGDGDYRNIGFGIELTDGRQFVSRMPIDLFENWKIWFFPLDTFIGDVDIVDTTMIDKMFFTSLDAGPGSFTVDNVTIGGYNYEDPGEVYVSERTEEEPLNWYAWSDTESEKLDSFTVSKVDNGIVNNDPVQLIYDRPVGSYGGQARAKIPTSWDLMDTKYISFWAKGDGSEQIITLRLDQDRSTTLNDQRSNFKKREFERWSIDLTITGTDWKHYVIPYAKFGYGDTMHKNRIRYINIFNRLEDKRGTLTLDDICFTNVGEPIEDQYITHEPLKDSAPIGEVTTKFPKDQILQIPKVFTVETDATEYVNVHLMNKTDKYAKGTLKIEGLPTGEVLTTTYEVFPHYISYPHYPWREMSLSNFKFTLTKEMVGEYQITVSEVTNNGVQPYTYTLKVVPPGEK